MDGSPTNPFAVTPAGNAADEARAPSGGAAKLVVIAASTGGPTALARLLPELPGFLGQGTVIVQHMPPRLIRSLAERLDRLSALDVREACDGDLLDPRVALLVPGGRHARIPSHGRLAVTDAEPVGGLRPRADVTIADAAALYGPLVLLVVLTGMGQDGLEGAAAVKKQGGRVIVEAESTCAVYGMPRRVSEAGLADLELPLSELAPAIVTEAGR
jgi:two-component system chemotaxis response regulator CheB